VVEGEKEGARDRKQTYSRVKERACYRVAGQQDASGGLRSMPPRPVAPRDLGDQIRKKG
jgi:hypothetical protein